MKGRVLCAVALLFCFCGQAAAQENGDEKEILFELSYNNYGPCVCLYRKDGKIMKKVKELGLMTPNNELLLRAGVEDYTPKLIVSIDCYDQIVGDSIIGQLYPRLKDAVKKKKKEDKQWAKVLKKRHKNDKGPIEMVDGGTLVSLLINMNDVSYKTSVYAPDEDDQYAFWFWDEMLDVCDKIEGVRGELPQSTIDELSENGKYELVYNYREKRLLYPIFMNSDSGR